MRIRVSALCLLLLLAPVASAQDKFLVPGDNLIIDGVPNIPQSLADKVARYTDFRPALFADWHPTKPDMLILTRAGDTVQVHHVDKPLATPKQITSEKDSIAGAWYEPREGKYFVFMKGAGGSERFQLYRQDFDTGKTTLLTDGKSRNSAPKWSRKGDRIAYMSTRRNGADTDLYIMDPTDPKSDKLVREFKGGGWHVFEWHPTDKQLLIGEYVSINESRLHLYHVDGKTLERITPESKEPIAYFGAHFSLDGSVVKVLTDNQSEFRHLAELMPRSDGKAMWPGSVNRVWPGQDQHAEHEYDVDEFARGNGVGALTQNVKGRSSVRVIGLQEVPPQGRPASAVISGLRWNSNGTHLAFNATSATSPSDIYVFDGKRFDRWTKPAGIDSEGFREPDIIEWPSFDGRKISGFQYNPPAKFKGKRPVIIDIHGGPESQFRPRFLGRNNYYLNEMGIALIYPNVRGSSGFGKTFLTLDNGFKREDSYKDIGALLDWIKKQPDLDPDRVMVTGGSYGGHMTLAVATYYPDRIRCAVDIVGISNLRTLLENTEPYRRDLRRVEYGDERNPKMREFLDRIAPLTNATKIKAPLFIVHGANDPRVPLSEAEQIRETLKKQGTPVWWLVAKDEGHGFAKKRNQDYQFYATVMFVEEYLLK